MTQAACSNVAMEEGNPVEKITEKDLRNPAKRFGRLPLEPQLHDPIAGVFDDNTDGANAALPFISHGADKPVMLLYKLDDDKDVSKEFQAINSWISGSDLNAYTVYDLANLGRLGQLEQAKPLCLIRLHNQSTLNKKRTVYSCPSATYPGLNVRDALGNTVGPATFNVKKATFGRQRTYSSHLGAHQGTDIAPTHPLYKRPFLVMKASTNLIDTPERFKFYATATTIRKPTGNPAIDSVMAVERKSHLVVLASRGIRDVFVFLRHGGNHDGKWKWKHQAAPGMLIATGKQLTPWTLANASVGPDAMKLEIAAGVDGRLVLAVLLSAVTHFQSWER